MIICDFHFIIPDQKNSKYADAEVDYYGHIPYNIDSPQHRLSLRKNLEADQYEIYRAYTQRRLVARQGLVIIQDTELKNTIQQVTEKVVFSGTLADAIRFANNEYTRFWGSDDHNDQVCLHESPIQHWMCITFQQMVKEWKERKVSNQKGRKN